MGIVRTRSRQIDACDNKIKSHRKDMKSFKKSDSRRGDKIKTRQRWIKELTERKKRLKHEMDYRQKLLKEISKIWTFQIKVLSENQMVRLDNIDLEFIGGVKDKKSIWVLHQI